MGCVDIILAQLLGHRAAEHFHRHGRPGNGNGQGLSLIHIWQEISCQLDLEIFAGSFAPALGLQKRFVGTEPLDPVTRQYNEALQASLPGRGIAVVELPRLEVGGQPVSASRVRACLAAGDLASVRQLVPDTTYAYCASKLGG